MGMSYKI